MPHRTMQMLIVSWGSLCTTLLWERVGRGGWKEGGKREIEDESLEVKGGGKGFMEGRLRLRRTSVRERGCVKGG